VSDSNGFKVDREEMEFCERTDAMDQSVPFVMAGSHFAHLE
jgi:hypothetical protein